MIYSQDIAIWIEGEGTITEPICLSLLIREELLEIMKGSSTWEEEWCKKETHKIMTSS